MIGMYLSKAAEDVYVEVLGELVDSKYTGLSHGQRSTYKRGCHGPLCRKAMRDYGRTYQREKFKPAKTRDTYKQRFDEMLDLIIKAQTTEKESVDVTG
jgi:hypothetical protein